MQLYLDLKKANPIQPKLVWHKTYTIQPGNGVGLFCSFQDLREAPDLWVTSTFTPITLLVYHATPQIQDFLPIFEYVYKIMS